MYRLIGGQAVPIHAAYRLDPMRPCAYTTGIRTQSTVLYLNISMDTFRSLDKQQNLNKHNFEGYK